VTANHSSVPVHPRQISFVAGEQNVFPASWVAIFALAWSGSLNWFARLEEPKPLK
jgi:hypothetical protein